MTYHLRQEKQEKNPYNTLVGISTILILLYIFALGGAMMNPAFTMDNMASTLTIAVLLLSISVLQIYLCIKYEEWEKKHAILV